MACNPDIVRGFFIKQRLAVQRQQEVVEILNNNLYVDFHMESLKVQKVDLESISLLQKILEAAPNYHQAISGEVASKTAAKELLTELPANCSQEQKHVLLLSLEEPIGVVDLILGYPTREVAYIGLLLLKESCHGKGLGEEAFNLVEKYIANFSNIKKLRLAYVDSNHVQGYWEKMGFKETGERKPYKVGNKESTAVLMEKKL